MKYFSHLNTAVRILEQYNGAQPFDQFIKQFFRQHKKYGSTDRKQITHLCYCCFRLGKAGQHLGTEQKIIAGLFLCSSQPHELLQQLQPDWNAQTALSPDDKMAMLSAAHPAPNEAALARGIGRGRLTPRLIARQSRIKQWA